MNRKETDSIETAVILAREFPQLKAGVIRATIARARLLQHYAECECNGELTPRQVSRQRRLASILSDWYGDALKVGGDPRGYVVKIKLPSGRSNNWGGEAWGVL